MKKIYTRLSLIVFFIITCASLHGQTLIYHDSFISGQSKWQDYDGEYTTEKLEGGKYYLTQKKNSYSYRGVAIPVDEKRNYSIETVVTHLSGTDQYPIGLAFGASDVSNLYSFAISANGSYMLSKKEQGGYKQIIAWTASSAIKTGNNVPNKLRIEKKGDQLYLFINDQQVAQNPAIQPYGNEIGFIVEQAESASFDYLTVSYLDNSSVIFHDSFTPGQSKWSDYDGEYTTEKLDAGKYYLTHKKTSYSYRGTTIPIDDSRNYSIETTVTHISGTDQYPIGLAFGSKDVSNIYYFGISANGSYTFSKKDGGTYKAIIAWTASSAIKTGDNVPNKLRIEKRGDQLSLIINDQQVTQTPMIQPFGNDIGFIVEMGQTAAFDYLTVSYLDSPVNVVVNNRVNTSIAEVAYHTDFYADDENQWALKSTDSASTSLGGGVFKISRTAKNWYTGSVTAPKTYVDMRRNFLLETEAIHYAGVQNYGYGLDFGVDSARQYHFWIAASGFYYIGYTENNDFKNIVAFTATDAVNKGDNAKNKLGVEHKDGQLHFYVNDQQVDTYPEIKFSGHQFGVSVTQSQDIGFTSLTFGYLDKKSTVTNTDTVSIPKIYITSPEVTRGLKVVQSSNVLHVAGIAKDPSGIFSVVVNDIQATVDANGNFTADVPMSLGENPLMVVAMNMNMKKGSYTFHVVRNSVSQIEQTNISQVASQGKFYALLIGVQDYQDQTIPSLEGPISDANNLSQALTSNYTFLPENVTVLKNPTRAELFKALDNISGVVKPEDNLLIFYAGHGLYDENRLQGYWFPSDAIRQRRDTWISNSDMIDYITAIKSNHTLLISDACFSGSIFKSRSIDLAPKDIQALYKLPSRKAMTSGTMKEVPDKSVFMKYLVMRLNQNTDKFLPSEQLFASFRAAVINNSPNGQVPQFGEIRESGDQGGDFVFIKKE